VNDWFGLFVSMLATWRLCHLVASEDGPFGAIAWARRIAGTGQAGRLMDCSYCLSLWFAAPFAAWLARDLSCGVVLWLAISGGACLIEMAAERMRAPPMLDLEGP
jgi:hypothetical protein